MGTREKLGSMRVNWQDGDLEIAVHDGVRWVAARISSAAPGIPPDRAGRLHR